MMTSVGPWWNNQGGRICLGGCRLIAFVSLLIYVTSVLILLYRVIILDVLGIDHMILCRPGDFFFFFLVGVKYFKLRF